MPDCVALIPAAGTGSRMGDDRPKQYLPLLGRPMLVHTIERLCRHPRVRSVYVVLAPQDPHFAACGLVDAARVQALYCGGESRAHSVRNALQAMQDRVDAQDWILVHDAARPCLAPALLDRLIAAVERDPVGGLLAVPVADTLKRGDAAGRACETVAREGCWQAQTPQMFRYGLLRRALESAGLSTLTDEASAVEALGQFPLLVQGSAANIKVTYPQDAALAEAILRMQGVDQ